MGRTKIKSTTRMPGPPPFDYRLDPTEFWKGFLQTMRSLNAIKRTWQRELARLNSPSILTKSHHVVSSEKNQPNGGRSASDRPTRRIDHGGSPGVLSVPDQIRRGGRRLPRTEVLRLVGRTRSKLIELYIAQPGELAAELAALIASAEAEAATQTAAGSRGRSMITVPPSTHRPAVNPVASQ